MRLQDLRTLGRRIAPEAPHTAPQAASPSFSPESPRGRALAAQDALSGLSGDMLCNVAYAILADHPGLAPADLHSLANRLSRAADERERRHG